MEDVFTSSAPIGTLAEILAENMDPRRVASCSASIDGRNMGCPHYGRCMFRDVRDANDGKGAGPENRGYYKFSAETGATQGIVLPCFAIMETERDRRRQAADSGDAYGPWLKPGEKITQRYSRKKHPTPDPNCVPCRKNDCNLMVNEKNVITIQPYVRPSEAFKERHMTQEFMQSLNESIDFEARIGGMVERAKDQTLEHDATVAQKPGTKSGLEALKK